VADDVVAIELRAVAGATYPLVNPAFTPDEAVNAVDDGVTADDVGSAFQNMFPYLGTPFSGFDAPSAAAS
jgi:hypothetical protein